MAKVLRQLNVHSLFYKFVGSQHIDVRCVRKSQDSAWLQMVINLWGFQTIFSDSCLHRLLHPNQDGSSKTHQCS